VAQAQEHQGVLANHDPAGSTASTPTRTVRETAPVALTDQNAIVVGVDGSPASDSALAWACAEARLRASAVVALHVISVPYELPRVPIEEPTGKLEVQGRQVLDEALARAPTEEIEVESRLLEGAPGELLVEASEDAELVVVGTRRHGGLASFVLGSVSNTVVHHAHCPVVVVRG